jgi:hypothetical protein
LTESAWKTLGDEGIRPGPRSGKKGLEGKHLNVHNSCDRQDLWRVRLKEHWQCWDPGADITPCLPLMPQGHAPFMPSLASN